MKYTLSKSFLKDIKLKIFGIIIFFALIGLILIYQGFRDLDYKLILGSFLLWLSYSKKQELAYWEKTKDLILLEIDDEKITISDSNESRIMDVKSVEKMVLQKIHGKVKSIIFHTNDGNIKKLEGFENMGTIAGELKSIFGVEKIKTASFFHR